MELVEEGGWWLLCPSLTYRKEAAIGCDSEDSGCMELGDGKGRGIMVSAFPSSADNMSNASGEWR